MQSVKKHPRRTAGIWRTVGVFVVCACTVMGLAVGMAVESRLWQTWFRMPVSAEEEKMQTPVFVIDPGHGGEDGGASGADGTAEKDLNLAISLIMKDLAEFLGYPAVLTRAEDTLLYDLYGDQTDYTGQKKTYDLRNRLRFAEESGGAVFCSIHMNKFPKTNVTGLQVYHSVNTPESQSYATLLQSYARTFLDPDNTRQIKKATSAIYLLHRMKTPAVLVECGFLSNPEECAGLQTESYQKKLAAVLVSALAEGYEAIRTTD